MKIFYNGLEVQIFKYNIVCIKENTTLEKDVEGIKVGIPAPCVSVISNF